MAQRRNTLALVWVLAAVALVGAAPAAPAIRAPDAATPNAAPTASALAVEVPYRGEATAALPDGWVVTACPVGEPPNMVALTCDGNRVTFAATDYSPDQGPQRVRIATDGGGTAQTLTYRVSLVAPEISGPGEVVLAVPVAEGTPVTLPYADLPSRCVACGGKAPAYVAGAVKPAAAGTVAFSGAGLVYFPLSGFSGHATLTFRVRDTYGGLSTVSSVSVVVEGSSHAPAIPPTLVRIGADRAAKGNVLAGAAAEEGYETTVSSCGRPLHGRATCQPDGSFVYTPAPGFIGVDQFSYHAVVESTGDQTIGSVAIGVDTDPAEAGETTARAEVTPVIAPAAQGAAPDGVFTVPFEATRDIRARLAQTRG